VPIRCRDPKEGGVLAQSALYASTRERLSSLTVRTGIRRLMWQLVDRIDYATSAVRLRMFDWLRGPEPRTVADEIRERRRERLRKAFPTLNLDGRKRRGGR